MSYKSDDPLPRSRSYITENGTNLTAFDFETGVRKDKLFAL